MLLSFGGLIASAVLSSAHTVAKRASTAVGGGYEGSATETGVNAAAVGTGVAGGLLLFTSPLMWYWWAIVLTYYRQVSGRGTRRQPPPSAGGAVTMGTVSAV